MSGETNLELDRPRSALALLGTTFKLYGRYPLLFPTLAAAVVVPYVLIVLLLTGEGPLQASKEGVAAQLLPLLDLIVVGPLISALHVHAVRDVAEGQEPHLGDVARRGLVCLPVVSATVVASSVGIILGLIALIVPGIVLMLRWAVVAQTAALEGGSWTDALHRSAELTRNHYLHIIGLGLAVAVLSAILWTPTFLHFKHSDTTVPAFLLGTMLRIILSSFGALATAVLYFDLKARLHERETEFMRVPPASAAGSTVEPSGHPLDPASYRDEDRPPGWYVIPDAPWRMLYWGADGTPTWGKRKAKTPKKILAEWRKRPAEAAEPE